MLLEYECRQCLVIDAYTLIVKNRDVQYRIIVS